MKSALKHALAALVLPALESFGAELGRLAAERILGNKEEEDETEEESD